jgi:signal peptidase I
MGPVYINGILLYPPCRAGAEAPAAIGKEGGVPPGNMLISDETYHITGLSTRFLVMIILPLMNKAILGAFAAALIMKFFLFDFVIADGSSMEPIIEPGTVLVVNRLVYGFRPPWSRSYLLRWSLPKAGDVVIFYTPEGQIAVKRCIRITGTGEFIAMGDNTLQSYDSRSYGPVETDNIIGKVLGL